ncbi:hypothetical protein Hsw_3026 [Hymenobacter swuensis DY53]|uniref:Uncharacterized protein n=1 Tax=Hymenobacter swuensis DY53 TaxID=1227739 RepID=W8F7L7_9BACT|nr:hypothetical protein Hsw_0457 [Hymenobacter swuensis DY53]AHJ98621.1 hypothetical protein Hsw_3026 [Hymenobacter swuensis DY53]
MQDEKSCLPLQPASIGRGLQHEYFAAYERHTVGSNGALHTFFE